MTWLKALVAGLAASCSFAAPVVNDGLTPAEILAIIGTGLVAGGLTYAAPNSDPA